MKALHTAASFLVILAGSAYGSNCQDGYNYCFDSLNRKGNYQSQIDQAVFAFNRNWVQSDQAPGQNRMMFHCYGGRNGVIKYITTCSWGCLDGGNNRNDYCQKGTTEDGEIEQDTDHMQIVFDEI